jgi:MFS family permease
LLAVAGFASQAQVRVMDSLLPQVAADLHTTVGVAAMVVTAYAVTHGSIQLIIGPISDRFGKYRTVALTCAIGAVLVAICGTVSTLPQLALARLATGAAAGWVIPISMAYVGDVTPHDRLQQILGRYISGQILGQLFGQAAGGVLGDLLGWRNVFFVLAGLFAMAAAGLVFELAVNPQTRKAGSRGGRGLFGGYAAVLTNPFARIVLIAGFFEGALAWGAFAYIGAYLHLRFGLSFSLVGVVVACFGIGGLITCQATGLSLGPSLARGDRRDHSRDCLSPTRHRTGLVARPNRHDRDRAWLLHAAQHATDQCHADDAASARHRRGFVLVGALRRADRRRRGGRGGYRSRRRPAIVFGDRDRAAGTRNLVCAEIETIPAGGLTARRKNLFTL